jgi:hypothetical protein
MTERKSPTAVLREGPRALSDEEVREIEESDLAAVLGVDIDDVIEYVHRDLKSLPDFTTLYRKILLEDGELLEFFKTIYFFVECLAVIATVPADYPAFATR